MNELANFSIENTPAGTTSVRINGEDVSTKIIRVVFEASVGEHPRLGVEMAPGDGVIEGQGVVEVLVRPEQGESVLDFLNAIDGKVLSDEALGRSTGLAGPDPVETALEILKEWASGA